MDLDDALEAVERAANEEFKQVARRCLRWLAASRDQFTCDEFWWAMARYYPDVHTHEPRVLGALVRELISAKIIKRVGYTVSDRPVHHRAVLAIYQGVRE